jgi:hypothetical protein
VGSARAMPNRPNLMLEDPAFSASIVFDMGGTWLDG